MEKEEQKEVEEVRGGRKKRKRRRKKNNILPLDRLLELKWRPYNDEQREGTGLICRKEAPLPAPWLEKESEAMPHCNTLYYRIRAVLSQSHKLCPVGGIAILFFCPPTLYPCGGQRLEQTGWGIKFIQSLPSKQMLPFNICFVLIEFSISIDYSNQKSARIQRECISIYLHAGMLLMHCY